MMSPTDFTELIENSLEEAVRAYRGSIESCAGQILDLSIWIARAFRSGGKLLLFGNGGSAADAQHMAAEFVNRFRLDRTPLPAIALTTDSSIITAISNDYSFDQIFAKQVEALAVPDDVVMGISTSGSSPNVLTGLAAARKAGAKTVALTGSSGGGISIDADMVICAATADTPRIQETHIFLEHLLCDLVEKRLSGAGK
ncbi:MAG TPA: SIS domain-containing protein [Thermodesulfobacteriaceae bacterium]|nr:SIS domain-containing protein [Thermodesulfobacteriaceae bacterium]